MAGYTVPIASDTKAFKQGIDTGIIKPVDDANKALKELGETRGPDQLERDMRDAQDATEKLADETRDTARVIEREYRDSFRKVKRDSDDAFDGAKKGASEFKDEARSTGREAAASFSEPADALDAIQETAANAFAGFGPAGAAAGIAAAVGIGVVGEAITAQQEAADELKRRLTDAYIAAAEEGRNYLDVQQIVEESAAIYGDPERLKQATEDANKLTIDRALVIQAMAGDEDALNAVIAAGNDLLDDAYDKQQKKADAGQTTFDLEAAQNAQLELLVQKYSDQVGLQGEAKAKAEEYLGIVESQNAKQAEGNAAAKDAIDKRGAALQAYADKAASIPDPVLVPRIDTGPAEEDIARFVERVRPPLKIDVGLFYRTIT